MEVCFQVLLNILSNSVKYTEVGRINLKLTCNIVNDKANLHIKISDTGFGIKKEDYDKIFDKFSRLDIATEKEIEGTGLGLVITKRLITLLGGKIWFESEYGAGTTFYIEITQKIKDKEEIGNILIDNDSKKKKEYLDCSKYKVMLVDDNELNLKVVKKILSNYKLNVVTFNNGMDCINNIKGGAEYDLIFLDHLMPGIDGIQVLRVLKKSSKTPPVIALTANLSYNASNLYVDKGFSDYLAKPVDIRKLNTLLKKYLLEKNNKEGDE